MCLTRNVYLSFLLACISCTVPAKGLSFGLVAKSIDDANFISVWQGCNEAAKGSGDKCLLLGPKGDAQLRLQEAAVLSAVKSQQYDALAISVISSSFVARALKNVDIPVITFDSPFNKEHEYLSNAYVGIDNITFGKYLAKIAKQLLPHGGTVCFMSAVHDPNLARRILGARIEFSGNNKLTSSTRLHGKWTETNRCPWDSSDSETRSLAQLKFTLKNIEPDVFISVGHWPIADRAAYMKTIKPFRENIINDQPFIIVGIGNQSIEEVDNLMSNGLIHGFVSIDFTDLGRKVYWVMKKIVEGKVIEAADRIQYISNNIKIIEK